MGDFLNRYGKAQATGVTPLSRQGSPGLYKGGKTEQSVSKPANKHAFIHFSLVLKVDVM